MTQLLICVEQYSRTNFAHDTRAGVVVLELQDIKRELGLVQARLKLATKPGPGEASIACLPLSPGLGPTEVEN